MREISWLRHWLPGSWLRATEPPTQYNPSKRSSRCVYDNRESCGVVVNGNGSFTPGRIVSKSSVLVPIAFGDFTFRAELPNGAVIEESSTRWTSRASVANRKPREPVTCAFGQTFALPEDDPEFDLPAGTIVTSSGSVTGLVVGR